MTEPYTVRPMTEAEAKANDKCHRCSHAAYWIRGEAKCGCRPFADDPGGPVKLRVNPAYNKHNEP